ncbi:hypothetical protein MMC17_000372 [Xylographa soralifera]|nr:hypothetical protein [Xylographa soralifera]
MRWHDGVSPEKPSTAAGTGSSAPSNGPQKCLSASATPGAFPGRWCRRHAVVHCWIPGVAEAWKAVSAIPILECRENEVEAISSLSWRSGGIDTKPRPAILDVGLGLECQQHQRSATSWISTTPNLLLGSISLMPRVHTARHLCIFAFVKFSVMEGDLKRDAKQPSPTPIDDPEVSSWWPSAPPRSRDITARTIQIASATSGG